MSDNATTDPRMADLPFPDDMVERHVRLGEDSSWEFKEITFSTNRVIKRERDTWADEIGAFANSEGGVL
ncbi:MAG: hypothetical protein OXB92_07285, partial [Acidimicrobiaceae bacterium]|nr:hypothetical protein [Acidimicrobiaceae bacterium]